MHIVTHLSAKLREGEVLTDYLVWSCEHPRARMQTRRASTHSAPYSPPALSAARPKSARCSWCAAQRAPALVSGWRVTTVCVRAQRRVPQVAELEGQRRGVYAGAVGYFSFPPSETLDTAIAIRTMVVKNGTAYLQAGGGIVYDSEGGSEYTETVNKVRPPGVLFGRMLRTTAPPADARAERRHRQGRGAGRQITGRCAGPCAVCGAPGA
jgi:hypothetical protein